MRFEDINFPVYRKYKNGKSYFKIINPRQFEAIQLIGSKKFRKVIDAVQLPERNFVYDLLFTYADMADEISAQEYDKIKSTV